MLKRALDAHTNPRRTHHGPDRAQGHPRPRLGPVGEDGRRVPRRVLLGQAFADLIEHLPTDRLPGPAESPPPSWSPSAWTSSAPGLAPEPSMPAPRSPPDKPAASPAPAGLIPAVLGTASQPLDVGRRTRLHTPTQRTAMALRDTGCTTEGCDRPPAWCEAHHDTPWSQGGDTSVDNGRLLCPRHHHLAHDPTYRTQHLPHGKIRFHKRTQNSALGGVSSRASGRDAASWRGVRSACDGSSGAIGTESVRAGPDNGSRTSPSRTGARWATTVGRSKAALSSSRATA
jgi:hypothetical protein